MDMWAPNKGIVESLLGVLLWVYNQKQVMSRRQIQGEGKTVDDEWLVDKCLQGRTAYWNVLVRRYRDNLLEHTCRVVKTPEDALDVVEETLFNARASLPSFKNCPKPVRTSKNRPSFFCWLCRFAAGPCITKVRDG